MNLFAVIAACCFTLTVAGQNDLNQHAKKIAEKKYKVCHITRMDDYLSKEMISYSKGRIEYNDNGTVAADYSLTVNAEDSFANARTEYSYSAQGQLILAKHFSRGEAGDEQEAGEVNYTYLADGKLKSAIKTGSEYESENTKETYFYTPKGNIDYILITENETGDDAKKDIPAEKRIYKYDAAGKIAEIQYYRFKNGKQGLKPVSIKKYTYNTQGQVTRTVITNTEAGTMPSIPATYEYNKDGLPVKLYSLDPLTDYYELFDYRTE